MEVHQFEVDGLVELRPKIFEDTRGHFFESYNKELLSKLGFNWDFVQDNQSYSHQNVLRGLHFQKAPYAQAKLVRVITGRALDVVVDIRPGSKTFGTSITVKLDASINNMLYIPEGFAHGFYAFTDCIFQYKCSRVYHREAEMGIRWNDPQLNIDWGCQSPIVSEKDELLPSFGQVIKTLTDIQ
jgi:dTDP-4-dehydrorhamnose 3,5-epimerase